MRKIHCISSYMMVLSSVFFVMIIPALSYIIWFFFQEDRMEGIGDPVWVVAVTMFIGCLVALVFIYIINGYEYWGLWKIENDGIRFFSLIRPGFLMNYADIQHVGIDYWNANGTRQFWIYFSKNKIDSKYLHRINRLPFTREHMRIQFSEEAYGELLKSLPADKAKQLNRAHSVIRAYHQA